MVKTGERFGYANYVKLWHIYPHSPCRFIFQDVACKQHKWEEKAFEQVLAAPVSKVPADNALRKAMQRTLEQAQQIQHVLPDAHGRAHAWPCQVNVLLLYCMGPGSA